MGDTGFVYFASYTYFVDTYAPWLPHQGFCGVKKQEIAAITGCTILSSYLGLFLAFYSSTYGKSMPRKALQRASRAQVLSASETTEIASGVLRSATNTLVDSVKDESCIRP